MVDSPITDQARRLLGAEQSRHSTPHTRIWLLGGATGVANLLFSSYFERFLEPPPELRSVLLYLTVQCVALWLLACAAYFGGQHMILHRTRIFPLVRGARFRYLLSSTIQQPLVTVFTATGAFAVGVLFGEDPFSWVAAVSLHLLLALNIVLLTCTAFVVGAHFHTPPGAVFFIIVGVGALLVLGFVIDADDRVITMIPLLSWVSHGILATVSESWLAVFRNTCLLSASALALFLLGRHYD